MWFSGTSSNYFLILVFITEIQCVYFVVQTESLNIIMLNFDLERLKTYIKIQSPHFPANLNTSFTPQLLAKNIFHMCNSKHSILIFPLNDCSLNSVEQHTGCHSCHCHLCRYCCCCCYYYYYYYY